MGEVGREPDRNGHAAGEAKRRPVAVDLFSGVGGFALGFEQAGFDVVAALEWDPIPVATHAFNFPRTEVVSADASTVSTAALRDAVSRGLAAHGREAEDSSIDVVFGGPPCQGFSAGGKREARDDRNLLIFDFARLVIELESRYFVLENVPPMRTTPDPDHADTRLFDRLLDEFARGGYEVVRPRVVNAAWYGVPQDRRRLIVIGYREGEPAPRYPEPSVRARPKRSTDGGEGGEADLTAGARPLGPSVAEAISDLPDLDDFDELWSADEVELTDEVLHRLEERASAYARRLRGLEDDSSDRSYPRRWDRRLLTSSMRTRHRPDSVDRLRATEPGSSEKTSRFYRLDPDGLCSTLRAGTGYDRGSFMAPRPIHPTAARVISVREAARLHSFPDWFRFHVTKWHGFRQIGNALPPLLGRAIGEELAAVLGVAPERPNETLDLGDPELLRLGTRAAASRFGIDLEMAPSHRLRTRKRPSADETVLPRAA